MARMRQATIAAATTAMIPHTATLVNLIGAKRATGTYTRTATVI